MTDLRGGAIGALMMLVAAGCGSPSGDERALEVQKAAGPWQVTDVPAAARSASRSDPALAVDPASGDVLLSWVEGAEDEWHLYVARSSDAGASWSTPARVTTAPNALHPHAEASPRLLAAADGTLGAVWASSEYVEGRQWPASDMRFARSVDGGRTWSEAITLNDDTLGAPGSHTFHGATWAPDAGFVVAWLDERPADAGVVDSAGRAAHWEEHGAAAEGTAATGASDVPKEPDSAVYVTASADLGSTWTPNRRAWEAACPCCRITLVASPGGGVIGAWRKHMGDNVRDVVTGRIWPTVETPVRVHADEWVYPGCPHTGPGVAVGPSGDVHVAWYTGKEGEAGVLYARSSPGAPGAFGPPLVLVRGDVLPTAHPRVAAWADGSAIVAYDVTAERERALVITRVTADGAAGPPLRIPDSTSGDYPEVLAIPGGRALLAWTARGEGDRTDVRIAVLSPAD